MAGCIRYLIQCHWLHSTISITNRKIKYARCLHMCEDTQVEIIYDHVACRSIILKVSFRFWEHFLKILEFLGEQDDMPTVDTRWTHGAVPGSSWITPGHASITSSLVRRLIQLRPTSLRPCKDVHFNGNCDNDHRYLDTPGNDLVSQHRP